MPSEHARFSPSAANRRIHCPPSLLLEEQFEEGESMYAAEGTAGHALAEHLIRKYLKKRTTRPTSDFYTDELVEAVDEYVAFVISEIEDARRACANPIIIVEQRVDASEYVDNCFGTADMVIITDKYAHVIDLKLGKGVEVSAVENPQLMIYGLGVLNMAEAIYDIETVRMTIFQPRISNSSTWEISPEDLKRWGNDVLRPAGAQALIGAGEFSAGSWCRFCKARNQCRARAEAFLELAKHDFSRPALLSDEEIADVIAKADDLAKWASAFVSAMNRLITNRKSIIADCKMLMKQLTDSAELTAEEKKLDEEMAVLSEMLRRAIEQNAHEAIDQEEYNRRYDSLNERYKGLEARAEEIAAEKRRRHYLRNNFRQFIATIDKADLISEFSPEAWTALVESVTVNAKDDMRFNFRNGMSL